MEDIKAHLAQLRDQAAECALLSAEAEGKEQRELFAELNIQLTALANNVEGILNRLAGAKTSGGCQD
jgi:hypothetical protein